MPVCFTKLGYSWVLACTASLLLTPENCLSRFCEFFSLRNALTPGIVKANLVNSVKDRNEEMRLKRVIVNAYIKVSPTSDVYPRECFLAKGDGAAAAGMGWPWPLHFLLKLYIGRQAGRQAGIYIYVYV